MEIVRVPEASELAPEDQPFLEATKSWFKIDFVPKMSRVLLSHPEFGRPYSHMNCPVAPAKVCRRLSAYLPGSDTRIAVGPATST